MNNNKLPIESFLGHEAVWINPLLLPVSDTEDELQKRVSDRMIADAEARLRRFAPFISLRFPETAPSDGIIESELRDIPEMKAALEKEYGCSIRGRLLLKMDSHLPIAGSVKARGGIYEVLKHAEDLAVAEGKIKPGESYARLADPQIKDFFAGYTVQVGSTGNLGMSIGITSAAFGFRTIVHMSSEARGWKKDLLRGKGVKVIEYQDDYSGAVAEGRRLSDSDPKSYFVDDEKSVDLFLGYAVAAGRLKAQLDEKGITVDERHPLIVYIPAGVGGAPGGITYGLKRVFRDNVRCYFAEPVQCPSVLLGIATQKFEKANVRDYGLSGRTEADGLACASPSGLVTRLMTNLVSGEVTVDDGRLYDYLRLLDKSEGIRIEPSACAGFSGPCKLPAPEGATHIVWATGGLLVPDDVWNEYLKH